MLKKGELVGLIDEESGITFLSRTDFSDHFFTQTSLEKSLLSNASFSEMFEIEGVKHNLMGTYKFIYPDGIPSFILNNEKIPKGFTLVKVNIFGNLAAIPIPENYVQSFHFEIDTEHDPDGGFSCKCYSGSSGCIKRTFMGAKFCEAKDCTSCSLIN